MNEHDYSGDITEKDIERITKDIEDDFSNYSVIDGFSMGTLCSYIEIGPIRIDMNNQQVTLNKDLTNDQNWKGFWDEALNNFYNIEQEPKAFLLVLPNYELTFTSLDQAEKYQKKVKCYSYIQPLYSKTQIFKQENK